MSFIFLKVLVMKTKPILVKQRHLATMVREHLSGNSAILQHISSCNACNHSTIENFHILSHGSIDFDSKVKEA